jgi:hypothetical protein
LTFNLSITALAVYFTFNSFDILKNIPSVDLFYMGSLLTHVKEDDDDDGLKFISSEDFDDPESMHDSRKITANSDERLMYDLNDYGDIFDFDPQNSPDPPCIIVDDDDDDGEIRYVHRKQTTQQDYLDSDYTLNSRFNAPYHVHK